MTCYTTPNLNFYYKLMGIFGNYENKWQGHKTDKGMIYTIYVNFNKRIK